MKQIKLSEAMELFKTNKDNRIAVLLLLILGLTIMTNP